MTHSCLIERRSILFAQIQLHIRRIIFTTTRKYGGPQVGLVRLSVSQVKQISGRAGRYGKGHTSAEPNVSALDPNDLDYIRQCVQAPLSAPLTKAGLYPTAAIVEEFASLLPHQSLAALLTKFEETARLDTSYFLASLDGPKILADAIERYPLPTSDRFTMVSAPVKIQAEDEVRAFVELARARSAHVHSNRLTIEPSHTARSDQQTPSRRYRALVALFQRGHGFSILDLDFIRASILQNHANHASVADIRDALARASTSITDAEKLFQLAWPVPKRPEALVHYEAVHRVVTLFLWLHYRFPTTFPGLTLAAKMKAYCENIIDFGLLSIDHSRVAAARQRREEERKSAPGLLQRIRDDSWYDDDLFPSDEEFDLPPGKK